MTTLVLCEQPRINNYFKTQHPVGVGRHASFWFFDCTNLNSVERAWHEAKASGKPFSCYRPFPLGGPWFGSDLIYLPHRSRIGRRSEEAEVDRQAIVLQEWADTRVLRMV